MTEQVALDKAWAEPTGNPLARSRVASRHGRSAVETVDKPKVQTFIPTPDQYAWTFGHVYSSARMAASRAAIAGFLRSPSSQAANRERISPGWRARPRGRRE